MDTDYPQTQSELNPQLHDCPADPDGWRNKARIPECFELLARRRKTTREFTDRRVSEKDVEDILELARWAPSPQNAQNWRFIVVREPASIKRLVSCGYCGHFGSPNVLVALVLLPLKSKPKRSFKGRLDRFDKVRAYMALSMCALNMTYAATEKQIDSCLISVVPKEANRILRIPKGMDVPLVVGLGYEPGQRHPPARNRNALGQLIYHEKYGRRPP